MTAKWYRVLQFVSGPKTVGFFACDTHKSHLEKPFYNFLTIPTYPLESLEDDDDNLMCDFCKEN